MRRPGLAAVTPLIALSLTLTACTAGGTVDQDTYDAMAAQAREHAYALAADLDGSAADGGPRTDHEVQQDTWTDCVPGQDDSGRQFLFSLRVPLEPGVGASSAGPATARLEADGWTFRAAGSGLEGVRYFNGPFSLGATFHSGWAAVGAGTSCIRGPQDVPDDLPAPGSQP